jgi:DNA polymerase
MTTIRLDFETRSHCDLKATGAWLYSLHPTTEVLCYAWKIDSDPVEGVFVAPFLDLYNLDVEKGVPQWCYEDDFEAHNAGFELAIWENIMTPKYGWPKPDLERFSCSAARAAAHGLPRSLDGTTQAMGLSEEKDKEGHKLMLKLCKPRSAWKKTGKGPIYFGTTEEFQRLLEYCKQDVEAEYALSESLRPLSSDEQKVFQVDLAINRRGVHCDRELIDRAIQMNTVESKKGNAELSELTNKGIQTTGQTAKIIEHLYNEYQFVMPNMQAEIVDSMLKEVLPVGVRKLLRLRQKHSKSSVKKYEAMRARSSDTDHRIRETILYHGAHTGRWTGLKIQPQNYPRPKLSRFEIEELLIPAIMDDRPDLLELYRGSVSAALSDTLRSALTAAPGHKLIGADYKSIEARVLCWLAGEQWAVDMYERGIDVYVDMAATIYNVPIEDLLSLLDQKSLDAKRKRDVGKRAILGLGYQMGEDKFVATCKTHGGIDLDPALANRTVKLYRTKYKRVKALWYDVHETAMKALSNDAYTTVGRPLLFGKRGAFLFFKLPGGRLMSYKDPQIRTNQFNKSALSHMHVDSVTRKWKRTTTYGGALTENLVQAIARDIMAHAMLKAEAAGYPIVMSVHDELVAEVPEGFGSKEEFEQILCDTPDWADGCPIAAEGWEGKRYRK